MLPTRSRLVVVSACCLAATAIGCDGGQRASSNKLAATAAAGELTVAEVNGIPILARDLTALASAQALNLRQALDEAVAQELLAQAAGHRGLLADPTVGRVQKREAIRRLLQHDFEPTLKVEDVPEVMVRAAYRKLESFFNHEELAKVVHWVLLTPEKAPAAEVARAQARAQVVLAEARRQPLTYEQFEQLGRKLSTTESPIRVERLQTARHGTTVEEFAAAALALRSPGQMSDVVRTRYGFHVIYLVERIPARHDSVDKVRAEIQMGIFPQYRQQRFEEFITRLLGQHRIEINQYALAALATAAAQGSTASPTAPGQGKDLE